LIGLFWFWTDSLIGNDSNAAGEPTAIAANTQNTLDAPVKPTATGPAQVIDVGQTPTVAPTPTTPAAAAAAQPTATSPAAAPPPAGATTEDTPTPTPPAGENPSIFAVGQMVVVTTDDLRLRDTPTVDGAVVSTLANGTQLEVIGPGQEADGYIWVEVKEPTSDATGYVADEFLEAAS
jgi:hypothetical protein